MPVNDPAAWFLENPIGSDDGRYRAFYPGGPVYGEITAYAISMACIWYRRTNDPRYLERARRSAQYLLHTAEPGVRGPTDDRVYTFDTGILVSGLLDLFAATSEPSYLAEATHRLDWLLTHFDGASFPATVPEEPATARSLGSWGSRSSWPLQRSIHLGKLALPLLKGWRATQKEQYRDAARRLFAWALPLQAPDGRFRINAGDPATMTHTHCYVTEALLYGARTLQDAKLGEAAERAAAWLAGVQNDDGALYRWYGATKLWETKVSDATAQALRIWRLLGKELHEDSAERAAAYLQSIATEDGGLPNYVRQLGPFHWRERRVNAWATFFWHHALGITAGDAAAAQELF